MSGEDQGEKGLDLATGDHDQSLGEPTFWDYPLLLVPGIDRETIGLFKAIIHGEKDAIVANLIWWLMPFPVIFDKEAFRVAKKFPKLGSKIEDIESSLPEILMAGAAGAAVSDSEEEGLEDPEWDKTSAKKGDIDKGRGIATDGGQNQRRRSAMTGSDRSQRNRPGRSSSNSNKESGANSGSKLRGINSKWVLLGAASFLIGVIGFILGGPVGAAVGAASGLMLGGVGLAFGLKALLIPLLGGGLLIGGVAVAGGAGILPEGYLSLANDAAGAQTSGLGPALADLELGHKWAQVTGTIACIGESAGCFRELMMNRTEEPGSKDIGETYRLTVKNFQISGSTNVRYMRPETTIPISFTAKNSRHGLKGIAAVDAEYKLEVRNPAVASKGNTMCSTEWMDMKVFNSLPSGRSADLNTILPGETVRPLEYNTDSDKELTLKECGLLNPFENTVNAILKIRYNYTANSFLNLKVEARDNSEVEPTIKRSKTPDTPVETSVRAPNPVQFSNFDSGGRAGGNFRMYISISTDQDNIKFKIDETSFNLTDSNMTKIANKDRCRGLKHLGGDSYTFSSDAKNRIKLVEANIGWFSDKDPTPEITCAMTIANSKLNQISPTGETITFSAEADYQVLQEEQSKSFQIENTRCRRINCPIVNPLDVTNSSLDFKQIAKEVDLNEDNPTNSSYPYKDSYIRKEYAVCNGNQDAQDGCATVENFRPSKRNKPTGGVIAENYIGLRIDVSSFNQGPNKNYNIFSCTFLNETMGSKPAWYSIEKGDLKDVVRKDTVINYSEGEIGLERDVKWGSKNKPGSCVKGGSGGSTSSP